MAVNKRKVLEAARKFAQKGAKEKALKEYEKLLKLDPRDAKLRLEVGDAHRRWGQTDEAIETYNKVADQYMKEGFDARAVAVFKQILNLAPENFGAYEPLADLYQRMGLTGEATSALQTAADGYYKAGDKQAALGMLRKMATLDPSNTTSRVKVADLLHQEGMDSEALAEYDAVAAELRRQNDVEGEAKVYERVLEIDPRHPKTLIAYAQNLLGRGAHEAAEPFARRALEADPQPEQYELLGEVLRSAGRDEELVELYRKLAELYRERGDEERTREILQRYVPPDAFGSDGESQYLDGGNDDLIVGSGADLDLDGDVEFDGGAELEEDLLTDDSLLIGDGESGFGAMPEIDAGDGVGPGESLSMIDADVDSLSGSRSNEMTRILPDSEEATGSTPDPPADNDQLFAEASVYLRYGKRDQAIGNLEAILEREPKHRAALEKLGEAVAEAGRTERAIELWKRAVDVAIEDGESAAAAAIRERIVGLDPSAAPPAAGRDPDTAELPVPDDAELSGRGDDLELGEIELGDIEVDIDAESFVHSASASASATAAKASGAAGPAGANAHPDAETVAPGGANASATAAITDDLEEADFYFQQGLYDEAEAIYARVLQLAPNHPHAMVRMGEIAAQRGDDPAATTGGGPSAAAAAPEIDVPDEPPSDIGEELAAWGEGDADELEIGEPTHADAEDEQELSAADLSLDAGVGASASASAQPDADADADAEIDIDVDDELGLDIDAAADEAVDATGDSGTDDGPDEWVSGLADREIGERAPEGGPTVEAPIAEDLLGIGDDTADALDLPLGDDAGEGTDPLRADAPAVDPVADTRADAEPDKSDPLHADTSVDFDDLMDEDDTPAPADEPVAEPAEPAAPLAAAEDDGDFGFDLAAEIGQALDDDANSKSGDSLGTADDGFAAVFADFKKGVRETLSEADHEAHYDLGIAYREMGLLDDAINEFRVAMGHPGRRMVAQQMMALCQLDAGQTEEAIGNLEMALSSDGVEGEFELALRLDLGRAHHQAGDLEAAREAYRAVQTVDPDFAGVGDLLARLDDPEKDDADSDGEVTGEYETFEGFLEDDDGEEADEAAPESATESYENFDDVMSDLDEADAAASDVVADGAGAEPIAVGAEALVEAEPLDEPELVAEPEPPVEAELAAPESAVGPDADADAPGPIGAGETQPDIDAEREAATDPEPAPEPPSEPRSRRKKRKISFF